MTIIPIKTCFVYRVIQKISDTLWATFENGWKCIFKCISWFASIIVNFNALCDAYTVYRYYTVLFKNNRKFCFLLGIIFENYFLTVSNKVEDHL